MALILTSAALSGLLFAGIVAIATWAESRGLRTANPLEDRSAATGPRGTAERRAS